MIELLTVLGIIALLCAIILPAVQSSREAARAVQCKSNLRQLALAVGNYESAYGAVPHSVSYDRYSCFVVMLPFLEQSTLYDQIDFKTTSGRTVPVSILSRRPPILVCASDPVVSRQPFRVSYNGNAGWYPNREALDAGNSNGVFTVQRVKVSMIPDGASQTALFSEILAGGEAEWRRCIWRDASRWAPLNAEQLANQCLAAQGSPDSGFKGNSWAWGFKNVTLYEHILPPNARSCTYSATAGSLHPGGIHTAFADGAVHFISESTDIAVWRAIGTRDGHEAATIGN